MRTKLLLLALIAELSCSAAEPQRLSWEFDRAVNKFRFSYNTHSNFYYGIIRYDIANDYGQLMTGYVAKAEAKVTTTIDPLGPGEDWEDAPECSGQCWFYLVEQEQGK